MNAVVVIPGLKVKSEQNRREHWAQVARRKKAQQAAVALYLGLLGRAVRERFAAAPRVVVRFARVGGRQMDTDNCTGAFKHVRDAVARWMSRDDGPASGVEWVLPPAQESGECAVRIELECDEQQGEG